MKKTINILSVIVGLVFLVSGYAKAADSAFFANMLSFYYSDLFGWTAPLIILIEITLGWLLILNIHRKITAWISVSFLLGISIGFAYAVVTKGMFDCGCFGHLEFLNLSPALTFVRNGIMFTILVLTGLKTTNQPFKRWSLIILFIGIVTGAWADGLTFKESNVMTTRSSVLGKCLISESPLKDYIQTSPDSTYVVFAFSFTCPHCNQSIGNIALYQTSHTCDRVIGLALEDPVGEATFHACYDPLPFEINVLPQEAMVNITNDQLPTTFFIRHDSILFTSHADVFSPIFIQGFNPNK